MISPLTAFNVRHCWPEHGSEPDVETKCMTGRRQEGFSVCLVFYFILFQDKNALMCHQYKEKMMPVCWQQNSSSCNKDFLVIACHFIHSSSWLEDEWMYLYMTVRCRFSTEILADTLPATRTDDIRRLGCWASVSQHRSCSVLCDSRDASAVAESWPACVCRWLETFLRPCKSVTINCWSTSGIVLRVKTSKSLEHSDWCIIYVSACETALTSTGASL